MSRRGFDPASPDCDRTVEVTLALTPNKRVRQRTKKALAAIVEHFNRCYPVGTKVILRKDSGEIETSVRYPAQVLGGHSAVAWFDGVSGAYSIEDERVHLNMAAQNG